MQNYTPYVFKAKILKINHLAPSVVGDMNRLGKFRSSKYPHPPVSNAVQIYPSPRKEKMQMFLIKYIAILYYETCNQYHVICSVLSYNQSKLRGKIKVLC